jgi:hypothetical protein
MHHALAIVFGVAIATASGATRACDVESGTRKQTVHLSWGGERLKSWAVLSPEIERVELPNGFNLGVKIEPASAEKYAELQAKTKHVSELVHISLFDLGGQEPVLLTHTWGGANSLQGYGASGGADRVEKLGDPGVLLTLLNPVCASKESIASAR